MKRKPSKSRKNSNEMYLRIYRPPSLLLLIYWRRRDGDKKLVFYFQGKVGGGGKFGHKKNLFCFAPSDDCNLSFQFPGTRLRVTQLNLFTLIFTHICNIAVVQSRKVLNVK